MYLLALVVGVMQACKAAVWGTAKQCLDLADIGITAAPFQQGTQLTSRQPASGDRQTADQGEEEFATGLQSLLKFRVRCVADLGGSFGGGDALHVVAQRMRRGKMNIGSGAARD